MASISSNEFNPSVFHPYYIIRSNLFRSIKKYIHYLYGNVLDFGCGSKPYRNLVVCESYTGVDFENEGHPHDNEMIDVFYDGKSLPFKSEHFDSILCTEVFEHIFDLSETVRELNRVLKKGGNILITCPFVWKEHELPYDAARYTLFAIEHLMVKHGFRKVEVNKSGSFYETIIQLKILLYYDKFYPFVKKTTLLRIPYKIFFILIPNLCSVLFKKFFRKDVQLYLNNVAVYQKC
ncbi:MAG: class I SAM-dependent methyltransferase [Bacteroidota bacterium]